MDRLEFDYGNILFSIGAKDKNQGIDSYLEKFNELAFFERVEVLDLFHKGKMRLAVSAILHPDACTPGRDCLESKEDYKILQRALLQKMAILARRMREKIAERALLKEKVSR